MVDEACQSLVEQLGLCADRRQAALERHLQELLQLSDQQLRDARYRKFRAMGRFLENESHQTEFAA